MAYMVYLVPKEVKQGDEVFPDRGIICVLYFLLFAFQKYIFACGVHAYSLNKDRPINVVIVFYFASPHQ